MAALAVFRLLWLMTLLLPNSPLQSSVTQLRSPDRQSRPVELGIAPIWIAQPPSVGEDIMANTGDRIVLRADSDCGEKSSVNSMTRASAMLASLVAEFFIDYGEHSLVFA